MDYLAKQIEVSLQPTPGGWKLCEQDLLAEAERARSQPSMTYQSSVGPSRNLGTQQASVNTEAQVHTSSPS